MGRLAGKPDAVKAARPVWEGLVRNLSAKTEKALIFYFIRQQ